MNDDAELLAELAQLEEGGVAVEAELGPLCHGLTGGEEGALREAARTLEALLGYVKTMDLPDSCPGYKCGN